MPAVLSPTVCDTLAGVSPAMTELRLRLARIAASTAKVLITGESGVGKELAARWIHANSARRHAPFVPVNCAGLAETLLESELFGHVRGSFTGAFRDKPGKVELAHQGVLLLDEVGEMSLRMQALLLRFLECYEVQKVGADSVTRRVDVRVIAATNRDLRAMVRDGQFRQDLFYRLNVLEVAVPPLRERREDVPALVDRFLSEKAPGVAWQVAPEALAALCAYAWPGNVRQLAHAVERIVVSASSPRVDVIHLPADIRDAVPAAPVVRRERRRTVADDLYDRIVANGEGFWEVAYPLFMQREITRGHVRDLIGRALRESGGNYRSVARLFGIERDYKRFLNFLRSHDCQLDFREFR